MACFIILSHRPIRRERLRKISKETSMMPDSMADICTCPVIVQVSAQTHPRTQAY
jgi:hypothetical protein